MGIKRALLSALALWFLYLIMGRNIPLNFQVSIPNEVLYIPKQEKINDTKYALTYSSNENMIFKTVSKTSSQAIFDGLKFRRNSTADLVCHKFKTKSSGEFSKILPVKINRKQGYASFIIVLYDVNNMPKIHGNDVILVSAQLISAENKTLIKTVAGEVIDNENGTYTAQIKMLWSGQTEIRVTIGSKFENMCRRYRSIVLFGESVYSMDNPHGIVFKFVNNKVTEKTRCSTSYNVYGYDDVCNLTFINHGIPWYCGRPNNKTLNCSSATSIASLSKYPVIMRGNDLVQKPIVEKLSMTKTVRFVGQYGNDNSSMPNCFTRPPSQSWTESLPTGIGENDGWRLLNCKHKQLRSHKQVQKCLKNKQIFFHGDSTVRQYFEAIVHMIDSPNNKIKKGINFLTFTAKEYNFRSTWRIHEMPYHCGRSLRICLADSTSSGILGMFDGISNLTSSLDVVFVFTYNAHVQFYHPDAERIRIRSVVKPTQTILRTYPKAKILIKGAHACSDSVMGLDIRIALIYRDIIFEELASIRDKVFYLDSFSISVAYAEQNLHPKGPALQGQIDQLFAYICE